MGYGRLSTIVRIKETTQYMARMMQKCELSGDDSPIGLEIYAALKHAERYLAKARDAQMRQIKEAERK